MMVLNLEITTYSSGFDIFCEFTTLFFRKVRTEREAQDRVG